jgi:hypothetical protein
MASLAFSSATGKEIPNKGGHLGGMKMVIGKLTFDTSYPDDGYTEAQLIALAGLAHFHSIVAIVPLGPAISGSGETANPIGWDNSTKTLRAFECGADGDPLDEVPTGEDLLDGATVDVIVIGV